jgi:hypothetical protein
MLEPSTDVYHDRTLSNRLWSWIASTRPAFLSASILPVLVAGALAHSEIPIAQSAPLLALCIMAIVLIHAGANVLNDCCDSVNGSDDANTGRIHPFTGGSRFIQNGVLTGAHSFKLGGARLLAGSALGLWVVALSGPGLLVVGLVGVVRTITYTAPPCLVCRGLGDPVVAITFAYCRSTASPLPSADASQSKHGDSAQASAVSPPPSSGSTPFPTTSPICSPLNADRRPLGRLSSKIESVRTALSAVQSPLR